jgi:hypothetical protein
MFHFFFLFIKLTLLHEQLVQVYVLDRIVEHLQYKENLIIILVLVDQQLELLFDHQVDDHNQLLIVQISRQKSNSIHHLIE